jgi:hypothetical protein
MIIKFDPKNPLIVETLDGEIIFEWQPESEQDTYIQDAIMEAYK